MRSARWRLLFSKAYGEEPGRTVYNCGSHVSSRSTGGVPRLHSVGAALWIHITSYPLYTHCARSALKEWMS